MKTYWGLDLIERECKDKKWGVWTEEDGSEIYVVFNSEDEFVGFEDKEIAENYVPEWEVGNWQDYSIKGEY